MTRVKINIKIMPINYALNKFSNHIYTYILCISLVSLMSMRIPNKDTFNSLMGKCITIS